MQGIVLSIYLLCFIFLSMNRNKRVQNRSKVKKCIVFMLISLMIICFFQWYSDSSRLFVDSDFYEEIILENPLSPIKGNEKNSTISGLRDFFSTNVPYNYEEIRSGFEKTPDVITDRFIDIFVASIVFIFACYIFNRKLIPSYCSNLGTDLYKLEHVWIKDKLLRNIIIAIQVWMGAKPKAWDICNFFKAEFEKKRPDLYIILGNPGEGKTISIRKISEMLLDDKTEREKKQKWYKRFLFFFHNENKGIDYMVPVIINFVDIKNISSHVELYKYIQNQIYAIANSTFFLGKIQKIKEKIDNTVKKNMKGGKFVFLFDGYDEITEEKRYDLVKIIKGFQKEFPKCYYIITSRTAVYEISKYISVKKENILYLMHFSKEKILEFLEKWKFSEGKDYWELYEKILNNYQLERLAETPLLLTLISYLYDKSSLKLPNSITEFYTEAIKCLLEKWESEKKILKRTHFDDDLKSLFLEEVAYWLFDNEEETFSKNEMMRVTKDIISDYGVSQRAVFEEIYLYSGILEKVRQGIYKFYHRSFYEFFLANYFVHNKSADHSLLWKNQNFQIAFFYLSLTDSVKIKENYIKRNLKNISLIEPLLIECKIEDLSLINRYFYIKKNQLLKNERYYQTIGSIGEKYDFIRPKIRKFFFESLNHTVLEKNTDEFLYIIKGFSYFSNADEITQVLGKYIDYIDLTKFASNSNMHIDQSIITLFHSKIKMEYKHQLVLGLSQSGRYKLLLSILKKTTNEEEKELILGEFLQSTKKEHFLQWLNDQDFTSYIEKNIVKKVKMWRKKYGWKWDDIEDSKIELRYILVYYLLKISESNNLNLNLISNRLKFVASYIKNIEADDIYKPYFVDIPDYRVKSEVEFKYHWEKVKPLEEILYNPDVAKYVQWFISISSLFILMVIVVKYRNKYILLTDQLNTIIQQYRIVNDEQLMQIFSIINGKKLYNLQISRYIGTNSHMLIFYFVWSYLQMQTYEQFIDKSYDRMHQALYVVFALGFIVGYNFIFQDVGFRIAGVITAITILIIGLFQHKYNMPSFRNPQFNHIRIYLERDKL